MHTIKFISLILLLFFSSISCEDKSEKQPLSSVLESATVELTEEETCMIALYHDRGLEGDKCLVDCLLNGEGRDIGGGCWHICFAYTGVEWKKVPGLEKCFADSSLTK